MVLIIANIQFPILMKIVYLFRNLYKIHNYRFVWIKFSQLKTHYFEVWKNQTCNVKNVNNIETIKLYAFFHTTISRIVTKVSPLNNWNNSTPLLPICLLDSTWNKRYLNKQKIFYLQIFKCLVLSWPRRVFSLIY